VTADRDRLIILGTGGHASVVADLAASAGWRILGCIGPEPLAFSEEFCPYLGLNEVLSRYAPSAVSLAIGVGSVGDAGLRRSLFEAQRQRGFSMPALIHPSANVALTAKIGAGTQIMAGVAVNPFAEIGVNVIVNTNATVEHHVRIGDHAHVAPGATLCGSVTIGATAHIGAGAVVLQGLSIGDGTVVGAGAVVTRDIPQAACVVGNPARPRSQ